jgi:hypothetical protein
VPLGWEQKKKLARLTGLVIDLSRAGVGPDPRERAGLAAYVREIEGEIGGAFAEGGDLQVEFDRLFRRKHDEVPPQAKAAAIGGWLKEVLAADAREVELAPPLQLQEQLARKVSLGFKLRSPVVRDEADGS